MKALHWRGPYSLRIRRDGLYNLYCASHDVALCVRRENAPLLRAAPDLYATLELLAETLERAQSEPELVAHARAALAMAADGLPE